MTLSQRKKVLGRKGHLAFWEDSFGTSIFYAWAESYPGETHIMMNSVYSLPCLLLSVQCLHEYIQLTWYSEIRIQFPIFWSNPKALNCGERARMVGQKPSQIWGKRWTLFSKTKMPTHRNFTYNFRRVLEPESPTTMPISYSQSEIHEPKVKNYAVIIILRWNGKWMQVAILLLNDP